MKPFQIPAWRKTHIRDKYQRKDLVIRKFTNEMDRIMRKAVDFIIDHAMRTGDWKEPNLKEMYGVSENFYRDVISQAFHSATYEKAEQGEHKRLSKLPVGLPPRLRDLSQVFHDKTYWRRVMKRSTILTDRLKRQYLAKLKKQFREVMPLISSGEYSPADAKKVMINVWNASKPRVETIFRTETTKYFAETQVKFFSDDSQIIGFLFDSVRDTSRTEICRSRHGLIYKPGSSLLSQNMPPCHFNCRSHLIALANTEYNRKLINERDRNPSDVKVVPLPPGWK